MKAIGVHLWGRRIGAVSMVDGDPHASFQYEADFLESGVELSPLMMRRAGVIYRFPALPLGTFHGLPGLLADSLPDRFGNAVLDRWLEENGRDPASVDALDRLCYTGRRGMGALEFEPASDLPRLDGDRISLEALARLSEAVTRTREEFHALLDPEDYRSGLAQIVQVGSTAGGARAKALIALNEATQELRGGQGKIPPGFAAWILKLDGLEKAGGTFGTPAGFGRIEYAYYRMATQAGIDMMESRLLEEGGRAHFMTRRFDRDASGQKIHMLSLGSLAHLDYNMPGSGSYEGSFSLMRRLGLGTDSVERLFRRMVFNVLACNCDDHVKNVSFLMDRQGRWALAPAYDMTYAYEAGHPYLKAHQMPVNGKSAGVTREDILAAGTKAQLVRGHPARIIREVSDAVAAWPTHAREAGVPDETAQSIAAITGHEERD